MNSKSEAEIESCFSCDVEFHSPEDLLEDFKALSNTAKVIDDHTYSSDEEDIVNSGFGEKTNRNRLIAVDDVTGLADESKKFASFLTVARKFNYTCVYIFTLSIWKNQFGEQFFCKRILLTSSQQVLH